MMDIHATQSLFHKKAASIEDGEPLFLFANRVGIRGGGL
jgi:hypothetical protein